MDYEKEYKKKLEDAKYWHDCSEGDIPAILEENFSELKESSDEKIRKALIDVISEWSEDTGFGRDNVPRNEIIAWLENVKTPFINNTDNSFICDIKNIIDEAPGVLQADKNRLIAWLEKQGNNMGISEATKQKLEDNLNKALEKETPESWNEFLDKQGGSKFKVGDWITDGYLNNKITDVLEDRYIVDTKFAKRSAIVFKFEHYYHLWTLKDAKDGDVLAFDNDNIVIFKDLYNNTSFHSYCHIEDGIFGFSTDGLPDWWEDEGFKPATREQRDLLFSKMKEACYEWDAEKKELKKIEQIPMMEMITPEESLGIDSDTYNKIVDECIYGEQKLTWSEKDKENLNQLHKLIVEKAYRECEIDDETLYGKWLKLDNWLKLLKERMKGE